MLSRSFVGFAGVAILTGTGLAHAAATPSYADIQQKMRDIVAKKNAKTVSLLQFGTNDKGIALEGLKIGSGKVAELVVATHHGNEYGSTHVAMAVAENLAKKPIAGKTVYVIPVLNTAGYDARRRNEPIPNNGTRDPNRDYPGPCGGEGPFHLKSTKALADFVAEKNIVTSATLHTFYPAVVYPWGLSSHDLSTPYDPEFQKLGLWATEESHYDVGNSTQLIYAANGTFEDYAYWKHGVWSMLFELGHTHTPDETELAELAKVNVPGIRRMLENAPVARAQDHEFHGKCDRTLWMLDLHNE